MNVTKSRLLYNAPEIRGYIEGIRYPAVCENKIDGEFNFIHYSNNTIIISNKYGTVKSDFQELNSIGLTLQNHSNAVFLCELYWGEGKQGDLYKLLANKASNELKIAIYDILSLNDHIVQNQPLVARKTMLLETVAEWSLPYIIVNSLKEAKQAFHDAVMNSYEGIVIKSLDSPLVLGSCSWVKMKYKDQNILKITKIDPFEERIEVDHAGVSVGVKVINRIKKDLKKGDNVIIEHYGVMSSGSLRNPIYKGANYERI